ncbi:MAG: hypothetical protein H0X40_12350 [Chthoniobacterales bacterium]|nr:hypothetical protein [Chthoniobacterales bacterium]
MNQILRSLETITTGYSVFEKDQVLTHDQLNSVADYCDDQSRLTRTRLLGVGIISGLRVSLVDNTIRVTPGVGLTTDGDLLYLDAETVFDRFRVYDESNPKYDLFYTDDKMNPVYQLVAQETESEDAKALASFASESSASLDEMVAVLFMEGYVKDDDLCSGTDCDNLGKDYVNTIKVMLIDKAAAGPFQIGAPDPAEAAAKLNEIVADRVLLTSNISTTAQLAASYRAAASAIQAKLVAELPNFYPTSSAFLGDIFGADPADDWTGKLNALSQSFARNDSGLQYYYDFLSDLVETWNDLRECLIGGAATWPASTVATFAKHLLLGDVAAEPGSNENRTGLYLSPMLTQGAEAISHVQFLARKLDTLLQTFQPPVAVSTLRITPSAGSECSLEKRAIPYYYQVDEAHPIQNSWSYQLHKQKRDAENYSYNAGAYGAQGAAANPLKAQITRYPFFRIEGHLGQDVEAARADIEAQARDANLPFTVQTVFLGVDKSKVVKKPGLIFGDLHRIHQVFRSDLSNSLENVKSFGSSYVSQVTNNLTASDVDDLTQTRTIAAQKNEALTSSASSAQNIFAKRYTSYRASPEWIPAVSTATTSAAEFKQNLGAVTTTAFNTPIDSLVSSTHANLLNWLDIHIQDKEDKESAKLLFSQFLSANPGLEHFGGVTRGGTFILAYDENNHVVGDFMLPYYLPEPAREVDPEEPILTVPPVKSSSVLLDGIKVGASLDKFFAAKLNTYSTDVIDPKLTYQANLTDKTYSLVGTIASGSIAKLSTTNLGQGVGSVTPGSTVTNSALGSRVIELSAQQQDINILNQKIADPATPEPDRTVAQSDLQAKELDAATKSGEIVNILAASKPGEINAADQNVALQALAGTSLQLSSDQARTTAQVAFTQAASKTSDVSLKTRIGQIGALHT